MLLLWNVMQNKKFQYDVKVWNVFGLCPLVIWTRPIGVNYWLSMENVICLAIQSRVNGATYNSRPFKVEEMGLPVTLIWTRPSPQCVQMMGRNKTLRGYARMTWRSEWMPRREKFSEKALRASSSWNRIWEGVGLEEDEDVSERRRFRDGADLRLGAIDTTNVNRKRGREKETIRKAPTQFKYNKYIKK